MEVDLIAGLRVSTLKVGRELTAQLFPGVQGPRGKVHEPRSDHAGQGYREIVGPDGLILSCNKDGSGVDLQELNRVDGPAGVAFAVL
jgi:hypothetical protein